MYKRFLYFLNECLPGAKDLWLLPLEKATSHRQWCLIYDTQLYVTFTGCTERGVCSHQVM